MKQALAVKLSPTAEQQAALLATLARFNTACTAIAAVAFRERCANKIELQKLVYYDTRTRFGLSSQMTIRAIAKVIEAYKRDKRVQPRFRPRGAITYDERIMSWRGLESVSLLTLEGRVVVPVRLGAHQAVRLDRRRGQADLIYRDGAFFLYVTLDVRESTPIDGADFIGVDLGIVNLAVDSDGTVYSGVAIEQKRRVFQHRRRNLQRKGTKAAKRKLRSLKRRQARYQRDTNHVISKRVVASAKDTARGIAVEDLSGIRERTTVRKRQRARHANWAFSQLRTFITYKAAMVGVPVVAVDPRNTSRTCIECGHIDRANRRSQSIFSCVRCGFAGLADAIAARVIAARARAAVMQPMVAGQDHRAEVPVTSRRP